MMQHHQMSDADLWALGRTVMDRLDARSSEDFESQYELEQMEEANENDTEQLAAIFRTLSERRAPATPDRLDQRLQAVRDDIARAEAMTGRKRPGVAYFVAAHAAEDALMWALGHPASGDADVSLMARLDGAQ